MIICLKNLAQNHSIAILTSIHQPNNDIVNLFDQLYVLTSKGQCIYNDHPSKLKQYLINFQVEILDYQVPIEELIKIASSTDSNKLISDNFEKSKNLQESWMSDCKLLKNNLFESKKSFNLSDLMIILRRTARNELIGGWKIQIGFLMFYYITIFGMLYLFPNDIGTDPGCTQERIDLRNISLINQRILDVITGNEQKFQQNIKFIFFIILCIYCYDVIQLCYTFSCRNQVSLKSYLKNYLLIY